MNHNQEGNQIGANEEQERTEEVIQAELDAVELKLGSQPGDDTPFDLEALTDAELDAFPAAWNSLPQEQRDAIDSLIANEVKEVSGGELDGNTQEDLNSQVGAIIEEEAKGIDEETEVLMAETPVEKQPEVREKAKEFKKSGIMATLFASMGLMGAVQNAEAGNRDIDLGRAVDSVLVNPEIQSRNQEHSAKLRYENNMRSIQQRYEQQAAIIRNELTRLGDPQYQELKNRQADLKIEIQYNKRIAGARTPEEKAGLTAEMETRKEVARADQQLKDEARRGDLELKLSNLDAKYEAAAQDAKSRYDLETERIKGQKELSRSRALEQILRRVIR